MINKRLHFKSPFLSIQILDQITGLLNGWLNYLWMSFRVFLGNHKCSVTDGKNIVITLNTVVKIDKETITGTIRRNSATHGDARKPDPPFASLKGEGREEGLRMPRFQDRADARNEAAGNRLWRAGDCWLGDSVCAINNACLPYGGSGDVRVYSESKMTKLLHDRFSETSWFRVGRTSCIAWAAKCTDSRYLCRAVFSRHSGPHNAGPILPSGFSGRNRV